MRTIGFRSNILFAIAAAFGVIASLGRPWYGRAAEPTDARMEDLFNGIGRAFHESGGTTGWDALETSDNLIAGLAVGTVALLVLALAPMIQRHVQGLARWTALATFGVVLVKLIDEPGANSLNEPRHGVLLALAASMVLVGSTFTVASAPPRKRVPVKTYTPPPAPTYAPDSSYGPPQY
jgi:drug/metabolite transporter (DMT)-like permease